MILNAIPLESLGPCFCTYILESPKFTSCTLRKIGLQLHKATSEGGGTSICMLGKL